MDFSLKRFRLRKNVTQLELSELTGIHQPNLSLIESGKTDPTYSTIEKCLAYLDLKLVVVPRSVPDVQSYVDAIGAAIDIPHDERAFRIWVDLDNRLRALDGTLISVALALEIDFTKDDRYNALIDGLFEYHLNNNNAPIPRWMRNKKYVLDKPWNTAGSTVSVSRIAANTPEEFFERNVFLHWKDLLSV